MWSEAWIASSRSPASCPSRSDCWGSPAGCFAFAVLKSVIPGQVVIKPNAAVCSGVVRSLAVAAAESGRSPRLQSPEARRSAAGGGRRGGGPAEPVRARRRLGPGHRSVAVPGNRRGGVRQPSSGPDGADHRAGFPPAGARAARAGLDDRVAIAPLFARPVPCGVWRESPRSSGCWISFSGPPPPTPTSRCRRRSSLCLLSFAVVCARTDRGLGALFVSSSVGGTLTRRLLPAAIVVPLLIGAVSWKAFSAGLFSEWTGITVMIVAMITLLAASRSGAVPHRSQRRRTSRRRNGLCTGARRS